MTAEAMHRAGAGIDTAFDGPATLACRRSRAKRVVDIVGSLLLLLVLAPVWAAIAVLLRLVDRGPVLFRWDLVGMDGRRIRSYKFRTMVPEAEALERQLRASGANEMRSVYFKMRDDPRVTPIGRVLRKYSLDEIPSLWSVLVGDLSLVGPRPVRVTELQYLQPWHRQRFAVKPGLTSPWVLNGKNDVRDFDAIAASDLAYIRHWSLAGDLRLLLQTVRYMVSGRNY
ncbi:MAG: sugar transferase [Armatimonadota bacterium]|nr:sugar transferase [Armatimonadota bacterium]MDR7452269.1 sugar transferase [Armatimonadota bacterium]MDR7467967.1 sugar transferase [Armatimonadota bacterium]MDR7494809.1 sugar transferase [Armatimonadota bacterium]MDR7499237.1 sugar transferase [Armatimonadota bacterium]